MMWMSCVMSLSVDLCSMARALRWYGVGLKRHCERSEAIQSGLRISGLLRFARNDDDSLTALGGLKARCKGADDERNSGLGSRASARSEEDTSELQALMRISYAV